MTRLEQTSKTLNYVDSMFTGPYFFVFMCAWVYLRHYLNLRIIFSLFTEFRTVGPFELNWETGQYKCTLAQVITLTLLASLQALNLFWLFFIIRIAYRFVVHRTADDDRSEAEESELEELEKKKEVLKELTEKSEASPLLVKDYTNGDLQAKRNVAVASPSKRKSAR
jgi:acyl-CoA-dependent ceramide synthase